MGGFRVRVREPVENKRLRRNMLDSGVRCGNRAASARKRLENKEAGEISHFSLERVYGAREPHQASALRFDRRAARRRTRGLDAPPSPLLCCFQLGKNGMKKWERGDAEQSKKIIRVWLAGEYLYSVGNQPQEKIQ
jgi:hypothetical protein